MIRRMGYSQVSLGGGDNGAELLLVLRANLLERDDSSGLLVDDRSETSLALDDDVRNTHLAAKRRKENDKLDGVNVICDRNKGSFLRLNEGDAVVQTVLDKQRLLLRLLLLVGSSRLSSGLQTLLLLLLRLRTVLVKKLEQLSRSVLVEGV